MAIVPLAYPDSSNPGRYGHDGTARLVNCYIENRGKTGKAPLTLYCSEGLALFADLGTDQPVRGAIGIDYVAYVVAGYNLYRIDPSGNSRVLGTIAGRGKVYMVRNRHRPFQLAIVSEEGFDYVLEGDELTRNPDEDLVSPNSACFLNGYIVYSHLDGRITSTALDDAKDVNALHFDTAEYSADKLLRVVTRGSEIWALGEDTIEIWQPAGGEGLPFLRTETIQKGCASGASVEEIDAAILWVAEDKTVRMARGYEAQQVSNHAVERAIKAEADPKAITSASWQAGGHTFYSISSANFTWVFDLTTGLWHERKSQNLKRWRCGESFTFQGKLLFGDATTGKIYEMQESYGDEAGSPLVMNATLPIAHATPGRLVLNEIIIDAVPGVGVSSDAGKQDPVLMLDVSKDGGKTWLPQRQLKMGRAGEHQNRIKANRFGISKQGGFVVRISSSSPVTRAIMGVYANIDKMGI